MKDMTELPRKKFGTISTCTMSEKQMGRKKACEIRRTMKIVLPSKQLLVPNSRCFTN